MPETLPRPMTVAVEFPAGLDTEARQYLAQASAYVVDSPEAAEACAADLRTVKARAKWVEDQRKAITKPLDDAKKAVMDFFRGPLQFLADAEGKYKGALLHYQQEEERKRRAEEARLAELARQERARLEAEAKAAEQAGQPEEAAAIAEQAALTPTHPVVPSAAPKLAGVATRTVWRGEVTDFAAFVAHVAAHPEFLHLLSVNAGSLNALARAQKDALHLPGVSVRSEQQLAARGG